MSDEQNIGQVHSCRTDIGSFENVKIEIKISRMYKFRAD
jgi:hypothetical protein